MPATTELPLGRKVPYPDKYSREVLCAVARADGRLQLELQDGLPFHGEDLWNAWELTWLNAGGKPMVAAALLRIAATSPRIVESKSLKLYLNSLAMERFASPGEVAALIGRDLSEIAGSRVDVTLQGPLEVAAAGLEIPPGACIDDTSVSCATWQVDPALLCCVGTDAVTENLHTHLLRSNCPVTGQPDFGSVLIRYRGPQIDRAALLRYIVSYRDHCDFHEACIERIFVDIKARCAPPALTVYGRFNRRGGLDINPFRSDFEDAPPNSRLWRQ